MKLMSILLSLVTVCVVIELFCLLRLRNTLTTYERFWQHKATNEGEFVLVALGDSTAQSIGASEPLKGYVGLLAQQIQTKTSKNVRIVNISVSGATVKDVTEKQIPQLKNYKPDIITLSIGGNDVARNQLAYFEKDFGELVTNLPSNSYVANIPYFGGRIRRVNEGAKASKTIAELVAKNNLHLVDLQTPLREQNSVLNYASDWFHPSNRAYKIWFDAFWQKVEPNL